MGREYKLDVIVDDHGGVQTLKNLAEAEDQVTASAKEADTAIDRVSSRQNDSINITRSLRDAWRSQQTVIQDTSRDFETIHVTADAASAALAAMGRGGGVRQMLNDIATAAGITVAELGALESAGLVLASFGAGWGVGRMISELTGLDEKIGNVTASLLGWGNVGAETAAAKADVLARASRNVGYAVTDMTEAIEINTRALEDWKKQAQEIADNQARLRAPEESARALAVWQAELEKVRSAGLMRRLTADIESHAFSLSTLETRYRLLPGTLQLYQRELAETAAHEKDFAKYVEDAQKRLDEQMKTSAEYVKAFHDAYVHAMLEGEKHTDALNKKAEQLLTNMTNLRMEALKAELEAQTRLNAQQGLDAQGRPKVTDPLEEAQRALDDLHKKQQPGVSQAAQEEEIQQRFRKAVQDDTTVIVGKTAAEREAEAQAGRLSQAHAGATQAAGGLSQAFFGSAGVITAAAASVQQQASAQASVARTLSAFGTYTQSEAAAIAAGQFIAGSGIQRFDVGGPVKSDGPIYAHENEYVVPKDGTLVKGGGGGVTVIVNAQGAMFEDDRALDRLTSKLVTRLGERAGKSLR